MSQNIFNIICKKCGGMCCKCYYIFVTKKELERLLKLGTKFKYEKEGAGFLMYSSRDCIFLAGQAGCRLPNRFKPLDCHLYPLGFIYKNKTLIFYLIKECAYHKEIDWKRLDAIKALARRRLKSWTEKEKIAYSKIIEKLPKKILIKL